ncbi:unnamed protein product, partial [marine sediment metagenome]
MMAWSGWIVPGIISSGMAANAFSRISLLKNLGYKETKGSYIVFVDTDQILEPTTIERAIGMMHDYDMVVFETWSYNTEWFIPKLHGASK